MTETLSLPVYLKTCIQYNQKYQIIPQTNFYE